MPIGSGTFRRRNEVERLHRITITSGHDRAIPITVLDRMPVARDERIEVSLLDESERPDRQDVDDRPGIVSWDRELGAGETLELPFGYKASWPESEPGIDNW